MILPIGHERMEAQRLPYITIGIVILNALIFFTTHYGIARRSNYEYAMRGNELLSYYMEHLYLELPEETFQKFPPEYQAHIKKMKEAGMDELAADANLREEMVDEYGEYGELPDTEAEGQEESGGDALQRIKQQQQDQLDQLVAAFEEAYHNNFYLKYGYIPSRGGLFSLFSSMFLHGGFLHWFFNMWFLWLSGCNIEDLWGRILYPIFYLVGGVVAALSHAVMFPESTIPLIGASGAISAVMGAFMIRMYDTKIQFIYFIFMRPGKFTAPAYVMLPLWLLQQLWEAYLSGESSGVAFWAHIGGFIFGAVVAVLVKITGLEARYIAPMLDKKTAVLDEHLAAGITKLQEGDVEEALRDLRAASRANPTDPLIPGELSRAYFKKGDKKLASREFKRAIFLYLKHNRLEDAVNEYLEISFELPDMALDPPQQMKIAAEIEKRATDAWQELVAEERIEGSAVSLVAKKKRDAQEHRVNDLFAQTALAYKHLIAHYQTKVKSFESPAAIEALTHYGDICAQHLRQFKDAQTAYQLILRTSLLSSEQQQDIQAKVQQVAQRLAEQAQSPTSPLGERTIQKPEQQAAAAAQSGTATAAVAPPKAPARPSIPIQKRIKLLQNIEAKPKYQLKSIAPIEANKVFPVPGGIDLKRPTDPPILFHEIYAICIFQFPQIIKRVKKERRGARLVQVSYDEKKPVVAADLFLGGKSRPYRIESDRIEYPKFFPKPLKSHLDNLRQFILYLISHIEAVYLDQETLEFLKTGRFREFPEQYEVEFYEKKFWGQLMGAVRFTCEQCWEVYWIDGHKIPDAGARTKCAKCGNALFVKRLQVEK